MTLTKLKKQGYKQQFNENRLKIEVDRRIHSSKDSVYMFKSIYLLNTKYSRKPKGDGNNGIT